MKDWDTNDTMGDVIDDDKHHLNYDMSADDLHLTLHTSDKRLEMMNHAVDVRVKN